MPKPQSWQYIAADGGIITTWRAACVGKGCRFRGCPGDRKKHIWTKPRGVSLRGAYAKLWGNGLEDEQVPVLIVEGEKVAESLIRAGVRHYELCTWPGGVANARHVNWNGLRGRMVAIAYDNDLPGKRTAGAISKALREAGADFLGFLLAPEWAPQGWDAADEGILGRALYSLQEPIGTEESGS